MRFNTAFLLKATAISALACLPMALMESDDGIVISACFVPIGIAGIAATQIKEQGEYELKFKKHPDSVVEIYTTGGRQDRLLTTGRILGGGVGLGIISGMIAFWVLGREWPRFAPLFALLFCGGSLGSAVCSTRQLVLTDKRHFMTRLLVLGRPTWLCWRWRVRHGDYLAIVVRDIRSDKGKQEFEYQHMLCVCRGRRRHKIAIGLFKTDRIIPGMETSAKRVAELVELPYEGYRESKGFWWS